MCDAGFGGAAGHAPACARLELAGRGPEKGAFQSMGALTEGSGIQAGKAAECMCFAMMYELPEAKHKTCARTPHLMAKAARLRQVLA